MEIVKMEKTDLQNNLDLFCDLHRKSFTATVNPEIIQQRYLENPYDELLMIVAVDRGKIVANYSAVPINIVVDGVIKKSALSINTMTDPEYGGRGLFTTLAKSLYENLKEKNYSMIIGFPNYITNRVFNMRLGWRTVYEIPTMKLTLNDSVSYNTSDTKFYHDNFENLYMNSEESRVHVELSNEYVTWRFKENKEKKYHVLSVDSNNWLIYQFFNDEVNITELSCNDITLEKELLDYICSVGAQNGFSYITTWSKTNSLSHSQLERMGFRLSTPIRSFGIKCFDNSISDVVSDYRNWKVQMGDDNAY